MSIMRATFETYPSADKYSTVVFAPDATGPDCGPLPSVDPAMGRGVYAMIDRHFDRLNSTIAPIVMVDGKAVVDLRGAFTWFSDDLVERN